MLTIVPTPIGNLKDITLRAIEELESADEIICEDSRRTGLLLQHLGIKKSLTVLNDFNEAKVIPGIIDKLKQNKKISLVSDAGTPLVSDPGFKLVREVVKLKLDIDSLPGPTSVITALTLSALPPDKFIFLGYPPDKPGHRQQLFSQVKQISQITPITFILFLPPFKILKTFREMKDSLGDINITLAKELTKIHQKVDQRSLSQWLEFFQNSNPKGEYIGLFRLDI